MKADQQRLALILLLALILRCLFIQSRGIQYDDAFSYFLSIQSLSDIVSGTAADTMPPLYYFLLHFWSMISSDLWFLRSFSVLLNISSIWLLFLLVKKIVDSQAGLWAAFFAAISPLQIYHAQDIRMYALLELAQIAYIFFFVKIWKKSLEKEVSVRAWIGLVFSGTVAMYTHNLAIFVLITPLLFLLIKRQWRFLLHLVIALGIVGLLSLPWLVLIPGQVAKIQHAFWTPKPGIVEVLQTIIMFTATLPLPGIWFIIAAVISVEVCIILLFEVAKRMGSIGSASLLLVVWLVPPILLFITSYLMRSVFVPRAFILSSLAYYGIAGWVISTNKKMVATILLVASYFLAAAISLPYQYLLDQFPRSPFKTAMVFLESRYQDGEAIVHDNKLSFFPSLYYFPDLPQTFLMDQPGSPNDTYAVASQKAMKIFPEPDMFNAIGSARKVYYVVFSQAISEYQAQGLPSHPVITWLGNNLIFEEKWLFEDLEVYIYQQ
jgi:mannosyltransferase